MQKNNVVNEFVYECRIKKFSERTIKGYKNNTLRFFKFLDENEDSILELEEITPMHIKSYLAYLSISGHKETYINGILKSIRAFFKYCMNEEYISTNPSIRVQFQREEIPIIETFTTQEIQNMIAAYGTRTFLEIRNKLILIVLADSGVRCQELCDIKLSDIKENSIVIHGKGKKVRTVPITPTINKFLSKYLRVRNEYIKDKLHAQSDYLFLSFSARQLTISAIEKFVKECAEKVGVRNYIRASPHTIRHYYAQTQLRNGCDVYTLSRLLGHQNISITKRYLQSISDATVLELAVKTTPLSNLRGGMN